MEHQITKDFRQHGNQEKTLDCNWRSFSNIIQFNNTIFTQASSLIQNDFNNSLTEHIKDTEVQDIFKNKISRAYADVFQQTPVNKEDNKGYVQSPFF